MRYRFENFLLDTGKRELRRFDQLRPLEPQVFDLLEYLITFRDRVVTRDDIFSAIWHDRIVSDGALSTRINAARRAVNDDGITQRLIRTVRTKGFRFVGAVDDADHAAPVSKNIDDHPNSFRFERPSIAVLPFLDMSEDSTQNKLADALTEEIITSFAKSDWLSVAARNSSFEYKNKVTDARRMSRRLGVRYLLEGSIRQSKGRAHLIIRLVDGAAGSQIWSECYDDDTLGLLDRGINDRIAAAVVHQVYLTGFCAESEMSKNPGSWEFTARILSMINSRRRSQIETARELLETASKLDTRSAKICSLFSFAVTLGVQQGWQRQYDAIPVALRAADAALALNSEDPWAHLALGYALIWRQPEEALLPIERGLKLNPKLAMGHFLFALASARAGWSQGISERAELGRALSAFDLLAYGNQGVFDNVRASACLVNGQHNDGIEFARRAIVESPLLTPAYRQLVVNCALAGRRAEAKSALAKLKCMSPNISLEWIKQELKWSRAADQRSYVEAFRAAGLS